MMNASKVLIHKNVLQEVKRDAGFWAEKGLESGGYLLGKIYPNLVFEITDFIDAGPNAERKHVSFSPDNRYAEQKKAELEKQKPDLRLLCEYHLHPWNGSMQPSCGDLCQLKEIKSAARPWYIMMLADSNGFKFWDIDRKEKKACGSSTPSSRTA
jgi:integrative and conjugative element protein (TIGR02256 family)